MIQHFFKLIWNRKKTNFMTSLGIFISFIVLFLVTTTIVYNIGNYLKPLGYDYKNVWYVTMDWQDSPLEEKVEILRQLKATCETFPQVEKVSYSHCFIFSPSVMSSTEYEYNEKKLNCNIREAGDEFSEVMGVELIAGRWFNETDNASNYTPIVINKYTKQAFFGTEPALDKIILRGERESQVIGIIDEFRNGGRFTGSSRIIFERITLDPGHVTTSFVGESLGSRIMLKMKPGLNAQFEETLTKVLSAVARTWQIKVNSLEAIRNSANLQTLIIPIILTVICVFMIFNVALGLFGVIWYNTNKRKPEIGLRRALGSTAKIIYQQILGESLTLTTIAVFLASLFVLQFPLLGLLPFFTTGTYLTGYLVSIIVIYLMTSLCALYPARIAASIEPAAALHYE